MFGRIDYFEKYLNDMIWRQMLERHEKKLEKNHNSEHSENLLDDILMSMADRFRKPTYEVPKKNTEETPKKNARETPKTIGETPKKPLVRKVTGQPHVITSKEFSQQSKELAAMKERIVDLETFSNNLKKQNEELVKRVEELTQRIESMEHCANKLSDISIKHSKELEKMKEFNKFSQNSHMKTDEKIEEINTRISEMKKTENKLSESIDKAINIFEMLH